ncbi:undecaprenyl-diphosphate phosphatase [Clostridium sp. JNZ X4-2]
MIVKAIIIGIVEGITELLPISSDAHIALLVKFFDFKQEILTLFIISTQLGTLIAIIYTYRKFILKSFCNIGLGKWGFRFWIMVLVGFYPSIIVNSALEGFIEKNLFNFVNMGITLITGGILLAVVENKFKNMYKVKSFNHIGLVRSLKIGLFSCIGLIPGMSRTAAVIMASMINGVSLLAAAEFSFFIAILSIYSSIISDYRSLFISKLMLSNVEIFSIFLSFIISFIISLFSIKKFIEYLQNKSLKPFSIYRILLGSIILILAFFNIV